MYRKAVLIEAPARPVAGDTFLLAYEEAVLQALYRQGYLCADIYENCIRALRAPEKPC